MPGPFATPVALSVPFEPNRDPQYDGNPGPSGIFSSNVQDSIEEVKNFAESISRFVISSGFNGTASTGRYLDFSSNVGSNISGFVMPRDGFIKELSLAVALNATTTIQVIKWNGVSETVLTSISLVGARKNTVANLNIAVNSNDELRVKVSSGFSSRPIMFIFCVFS